MIDNNYEMIFKRNDRGLLAIVFATSLAISSATRATNSVDVHTLATL
jgi:hypothetical protein